MKNKVYTLFQDKESFFKALGTVTDKLNIEKMIELLGSTPFKKMPFVTKEGRFIMCGNAKTFFINVEAECKIGLLAPISYLRGSQIHVFTTEDIFSAEVEVKAGDKVGVVVDEDTVLDGVVVEKEAGELEVIVDETPEVISEKETEVDWAKLDEMVEAGSKKALEEYAREFGIELSRRKTAANMLKDFKTAYNK